jgi:hypothetical protein
MPKAEIALTIEVTYANQIWQIFTFFVSHFPCFSFLLHLLLSPSTFLLPTTTPQNTVAGSVACFLLVSYLRYPLSLLGSNIFLLGQI